MPAVVLQYTNSMGKTQSKSGKVGGADAVDGGKAGRAGKREVEEVFVEKIAYKCGVSEAELEQKKEVSYCVHILCIFILRAM